MKKIIISIVCLVIVVLGALWLANKKDDTSTLKKVKVAEVAHSIFYAPQYLAHALGYFEEEGLDVEIILANGADAVAASVMSDDVQIGFCGSEQTIYVYNQGAKDYLINFSSLTKKDGSFLVARKEMKDFSISDLKGSHIIAGRKAGMPAMTLEWVLNQNGIKTEDVNFDTSIAFAAMSGAFIGGTGDYVSLFDDSVSIKRLLIFIKVLSYHFSNIVFVFIYTFFINLWRIFTESIFSVKVFSSHLTYMFHRMIS